MSDCSNQSLPGHYQFCNSRLMMVQNYENISERTLFLKFDFIMPSSKMKLFNLEACNMEKRTENVYIYILWQAA